MNICIGGRFAYQRTDVDGHVFHLCIYKVNNNLYMYLLNYPHQHTCVQSVMAKMALDECCTT